MLSNSGLSLNYISDVESASVANVELATPELRDAMDAHLVAKSQWQAQSADAPIDDEVPTPQPEPSPASFTGKGGPELCATAKGDGRGPASAPGCLTTPCHLQPPAKWPPPAQHKPPPAPPRPLPKPKPPIPKPDWPPKLTPPLPKPEALLPQPKPRPPPDYRCDVQSEGPGPPSVPPPSHLRNQRYSEVIDDDIHVGESAFGPAGCEGGNVVYRDGPEPEPMPEPMGGGGSAQMLSSIASSAAHRVRLVMAGASDNEVLALASRVSSSLPGRSASAPPTQKSRPAQRMQPPAQVPEYIRTAPWNSGQGNGPAPGPPSGRSAPQPPPGPPPAHVRWVVDDESGWDLVPGSWDKWLCAFVDVHVAVEWERATWAGEPDQLRIVPPQFRAAMDEVHTTGGCTWDVACEALKNTVPNSGSLDLFGEEVKMTLLLGIMRGLMQRGVNDVLEKHWFPLGTSLPNVAVIMAIVNTRAQVANIGLRIAPGNEKGLVGAAQSVKRIIIDREFGNPSSRGGKRRTQHSSGQARLARLRLG